MGLVFSTVGAGGANVNLLRVSRGAAMGLGWELIISIRIINVHKS